MRYKSPPSVFIELVLIPFIPSVTVLKTQRPFLVVALTGSAHWIDSSQSICALLYPPGGVGFGPLSTWIPAVPRETPEPNSPVLSNIMLSLMFKFDVLIVVVLPCTTRFPVNINWPPAPVSMVTLPPLITFIL